MILRGALAILLSIPLVLSASTPLIIVAPAAPGGGWDQTARGMQRVLTAIEPGASVQVDNVPGAAGTIGLARFVQSERGNPHALLVTGLVMVSGVITNHSPVSLADATPIARPTVKPVIVVPASSAYRSMPALADASRPTPDQSRGLAGIGGGTDDLLVRADAEKLGFPPRGSNYIALAAAAPRWRSAGRQVTAAVSGYGEFAGQIAAGELRRWPFGAGSHRRHRPPTLRESGIALDLANWPPSWRHRDSQREHDALIGARHEHGAAAISGRRRSSKTDGKTPFSPARTFGNSCLLTGAGGTPCSGAWPPARRRHRNAWRCR